MNHRKITTLTAAFAGVFAVSGAAQAAPWALPTGPTGANTRFGWSNGDHPGGVGVVTGAFGTPSVDVDGFHFIDEFGDMNFHAQVGGPTVINSKTRAVVDVATSVPANALPLNEIRVVETGTYQGDPASFQVTASLQVFTFVGNKNTQSIALDPATFLPDGTWFIDQTFTFSDLAAFPLPGNTFPNIPLTKFKFDLVNILHANGSTAGNFIEKTSAHVYLPEPSSCLLFAVGTIGLMRYRRSASRIH